MARKKIKLSPQQIADLVNQGLLEDSLGLAGTQRGTQGIVESYDVQERLERLEEKFAKIERVTKKRGPVKKAKKKPVKAKKAKPRRLKKKRPRLSKRRLRKTMPKRKKKLLRRAAKRRMRKRSPKRRR